MTLDESRDSLRRIAAIEAVIFFELPITHLDEFVALQVFAAETGWRAELTADSNIVRLFREKYSRKSPET
jgi:hypothetical protein